MEIKKIGILGAGSMGSGIANVAALNGFNVLLCDVEQSVLDNSLKTYPNLWIKELIKENNL